MQQTWGHCSQARTIPRTPCLFGPNKTQFGLLAESHWRNGLQGIPFTLFPKWLWRAFKKPTVILVKGVFSPIFPAHTLPALRPTSSNPQQKLPLHLYRSCLLFHPELLPHIYLPSCPPYLFSCSHLSQGTFCFTVQFKYSKTYPWRTAWSRHWEKSLFWCTVSAFLVPALPILSCSFSQSCLTFF